MNKVENIKQLDALIGQAYIYGAITVIVALGIAYLIANAIAFQGGKTDRSFMKRRVWFIIIGVVSFIVFFLYNQLLVMDKITKAPLQAKFSTTILIITVGIIVLYFSVGIVTMLAFRKSKWGSILGKTK